MPSRPWDWKIIEPEDGKSCRRDRSRAPVRSDGGHGSHPGARGAIQVAGDRRRLPSSRGILLFSKRKSLEEGGVDGRGGSFQLLSRKELGRLWGGGSGYDKRSNARKKSSHAARPWPTAKISPR